MRRVLVHAHTTYSRDGRYSPARLARLAASRGFDAVLVSDHWEHLDRPGYARLVAECDEQTACLLVPGYERSWTGFHLCAYGVRSWIAATDLTSWAQGVREDRGLVCLVHPARYGFRVPESILEACDAVEVWNSKRPYDGGLAPHPDAALLLRPHLLAMAGQDFHRRSDLTTIALRMARNPSPGKLMNEIRAGRFSITSRWLRFERQPPSRLWPLLRMWQGVRPRLWAVPIAVFRSLRRLRKRRS